MLLSAIVSPPSFDELFWPFPRAATLWAAYIIQLITRFSLATLSSAA
jgi:hypothetical protein